MHEGALLSALFFKMPLPELYGVLGRQNASPLRDLDLMHIASFQSFRYGIGILAILPYYYILISRINRLNKLHYVELSL